MLTLNVIIQREAVFWEQVGGSIIYLGSKIHDRNYY
jgi:hypothetical protein